MAEIRKGITRSLPQTLCYTADNPQHPIALPVDASDHGSAGNWFPRDSLIYPKLQTRAV